MCDKIEMQQEFEALVESYGCDPVLPHEYEIGIFNAMNAFCLAQGDDSK